MSAIWCEQHRNQMRRAMDGWPVWPIDEFLSRRPVTAHVEERLRRLNPNGICEGDMPRGLHRKTPVDGKAWPRHVRSVRDFSRIYLDSLPHEAFFRDGKRRCVIVEASR